MERILLASDCTIYPIDSKTDLSSFQCGDSDLDDFFKNDAYLYSKQLLGKSYIAVTNFGSPKIVCAFTLANDSIKSTMIPKSSRNRLERNVPNAKHTRTYPALLIGRLGVNGEFQKNSFHFLYSDEMFEREAFHIDKSQSLKTRMMYLDLIDFVA